QAFLVDALKQPRNLGVAYADWAELTRPLDARPAVDFRYSQSRQIVLLWKGRLENVIAVAATLFVESHQAFDDGAAVRIGQLSRPTALVQLRVGDVGEPVW